MTDLRVRGLRRSFGPVVALDSVDLVVHAGELVSVVGPSGCGKTTLLRIVAGFERADAGTVSIGDREVVGPKAFVPAHRRRVGIVPQDGALFEHLDVAGNIGFGLGAGDRRSRVPELLELMGLTGLADRRPAELSGGQQQRVAVARALAPRPPLVLLDEPFSALDAGLRAGVRADIRQALRVDGATALLVTHDQDEALSISDRVAVLHAGRILQVGGPEEVYGQPASQRVADFLGESVVLPVTELLAGDAGTLARTSCGLLEVHGAAPAGADHLVAVLRPEQIGLVPALSTSELPVAVVQSVSFHGHDSLVTARLEDGTTLRSRMLGSGPDGARSVGERVVVRVSSAARLCPAE